MSSFGRVFRVSTFGESHCKGVGVVVDGIPPRMRLSEKDVQVQLSRRRPGQSDIATPRNEEDEVMILSGIENGWTLGTPIAMVIYNKDQRPTDYGDGSIGDVPRPSHADFSYQAKYGIRASSGGGRASARETIGRVASGAVAEIWLQQKYGIEIVAWVSGVAEIRAPISLETAGLTRSRVDQTIVRCPHPETASAMTARIRALRDAHDSCGGVVTCVMRNVPAGWGEPVFDKLEALLAHAMLSIPATKGFEVGSGFTGSTAVGSAHNDPFEWKDGRLRTTTNNSGGIQGGISNGENIVIRVAFKPPATIGKAQTTVDFDGKTSVLQAKGRHDPCVVNRAVPIVETMCALVLADAAMLQEARTGSALPYPVQGRANTSVYVPSIPVPRL
jgi:chorismate synthase